MVAAGLELRSLFLLEDVAARSAALADGTGTGGR
jgi:hypothetical protein